MNHIEWTEHKIMGFKPAKRDKIIPQSLLLTPSSSISLSTKSFVNITFYRAKHNELQRGDS